MDNSQDIIDSRDVIARIEELESEREALHAELEEAETAHDEAEDGDLEAHDAHAAALAALNEWDTENAEELAALLALAGEGAGYAADWHHGETLIRDSYFTEYAQQLADDIGAIDANQAWPNNCIDWEQAARELQMDYSGIDFDGVTYWVR